MARIDSFENFNFENSDHSDSVIEHLVMSPLCPWLQRLAGRRGIKSTNLNEKWRRQQQRLPSNVFSFLTISHEKSLREIGQIYISGMCELSK